MSPQSQSEQETHLNMAADDRSFWEVFSDDPVMQNKLEKLGATLVRVSNNGNGKFYTLHTDQVLFRKGKPKRAPQTEAQLAAFQEVLLRRQSLDGVKDSKEDNDE